MEDGSGVYEKRKVDSFLFKNAILREAATWRRCCWMARKLKTWFPSISYFPVWLAAALCINYWWPVKRHSLGNLIVADGSFTNSTRSIDWPFFRSISGSALYDIHQTGSFIFILHHLIRFDQNSITSTLYLRLNDGIIYILDRIG